MRIFVSAFCSLFFIHEGQITQLFSYYEDPAQDWLFELICSKNHFIKIVSPTWPLDRKRIICSRSILFSFHSISFVRDSCFFSFQQNWVVSTMFQIQYCIFFFFFGSTQCKSTWERVIRNSDCIESLKNRAFLKSQCSLIFEQWNDPRLR